MIDRFIELIEENRLFFELYIAFIILASIFVFAYDQLYVSYHLNSIHNIVFDNFFKYITHFGDGLFVLFVSIVIFWKNRELAISLFLSFLLSGLFAQIVKNIISFPRPKHFIEKLAAVDQLAYHFVNGVEVYSSNSMPSGHTTTIFCFVCMIILYTKNKLWTAALFGFAFAVAMSRVYLLQHFLQDVLVGSILGVYIAMIFFVYKDKLYATSIFRKILNKREIEQIQN
jgi:membrane-associated phospholipid phosphatase